MTSCMMCAGREWSLDVDYGSATAETGAAYLAMLSIDSILGLVTSIEKLTDMATEGSPGSPGKTPNGVPAWMPVEREHCTALIEVSWRTILDTLSQLLSRTSGEALIVQLLKACFHLSQWAQCLQSQSKQLLFYIMPTRQWLESRIHQPFLSGAACVESLAQPSLI